MDLQNKEFSIDFQFIDLPNPSSIEEATRGYLTIRVKGINLTENVSDGVKSSSILVSASLLVEWFLDTWVEIRRNNFDKYSIEWKLSHKLASVGEGYIWPNITFEPLDKDNIYVSCEARSWCGVEYVNSLEPTLISSRITYSDFYRERLRLIKDTFKVVKEKGFNDEWE